MLASLLPGLRQLRAPLIAGALCIASLFLMLYESSRTSLAQEDLSAGLEALSDLLGAQGRLAALSVVTYLVGAGVVALVGALRRRGHLLALPQLVLVTGFSSSTTWPTRWCHVTRSPFTYASLVRLRRKCNDDQQLLKGVLADIINGGGVRLLASNTDLYQEYDRIRAEAEFREAVAVPGLVLLFVMVQQVAWGLWTETLVGALVLIGLLLLLVQAQALHREANSMYAHTVADGVVSTASLDLIA